MNHTKVLEQTWRILWNYRALWLFGILLALVTFSWGPAAFLDRDDDGWEQPGIVITRQPGETFLEAFQRTMRKEVEEANRELSELFDEELGITAKANVLIIAAVLMAVALAAWVVARIVRYVSETALIRMVGEHQDTGERLRVRQGLRLGWSRRGWRLFLIDLLMTAPAVLAGFTLFGLILAPLPLWVSGSEGVIFTFAFLTGGLLLVAMVVVIFAAAAIAVWKRLSHQACALEGLGVSEAIGRGWRLLRRHLRDAGLIWLVTFGVRVGLSVATVPLVLLLLGAGLMIGGLPAVAAGGLAGLAASGDIPLFVGLALGVPLFLLILVAPLMSLAGLREVFLSSLWTLTYRELQGLEGVEPEPLPVVDPSGLEAATAA